MKLKLVTMIAMAMFLEITISTITGRDRSRPVPTCYRFKFLPTVVDHPQSIRGLRDNRRI